MTPSQAKRWPHARAGARITREALLQFGWSGEGTAWVWPLIAGHHGVVPTAQALEPPGGAHGRGRWRSVQQEFVATVAAELNLDLLAFADVGRPARGRQLALSGLIIMADWVASDDQHFPGLADLSQVSFSGARERADRAWTRLGLRGGWRPSAPAPPDHSDLVLSRFGVSGRPAQAAAVLIAERMVAPGLVIMEAPMGEGKTEAALVVAEVLARRFGADGVFVGMPTQATSDPMFTRVRSWLSSVDPDVPIALLHGRRRFNREWAELRSQVRFIGVGDDLDEYGMTDGFGVAGAGESVAGDAPAEWFLGNKRGLLTPVTVGTVDQLLHAATRTRHVMLRHAGLAGRVVVLDEVHAYDVYMAQFLFEALRWLGDTGVPVVLLSATLPPPLRAALVRAYLQGAVGVGAADAGITELPAPTGYPSTTAVTPVDGRPTFDVTVGRSWRSTIRVAVEVLAENPSFEPGTVANTLLREIGAGGTALVVCNTVGRAQDVYRALTSAFGADVVLLHSRLIATERADRTERLVDLLGPPGRKGAPDRPPRLVLVATQVAEQSFDVDVDLIVSDLAPIDLLLQRVGRLHRHERPAADRPTTLSHPRVVVSGVRLDPDRPPSWPGGSRAVYGDHLLLRSAALVADATIRGGWSVPADVPDLVARGYGEEPLGPPEWAAVAAHARRKQAERDAHRQGNAVDYLLTGEHAWGKPTLAGLHERPTGDLSEDTVAAVVRDGDPSVEVVLVRGTPGGYLTLGGRSLGPNGDISSDDALVEEVTGATLRLPPSAEITAAALAELSPLPGWAHDPWLRRARALVLDEEMSVVLGTHLLTYDDEVGLTVRREGHR